MDAEAQAVETNCETERPEARIVRLQRGDVLRIDQGVIHRGNGVLPDEFFGRNLRPEIAGARAHIAVRELEPCPGERVGELIGVRHEPPTDLLVRGVDSQ